MDRSPTQNSPVAIAPALSSRQSDGGQGNDSPRSTTMSYACQTCVRRKVKCDRSLPLCTSCITRKLECFYQAPQPRRPKRKRSVDTHDGLDLARNKPEGNGLQSNANTVSVMRQESSQNTQDLSSFYLTQPHPAGIGRLLAGDGKARYIDGSLWRDFGEDDMREISEDEEDDQSAQLNTGKSSEDPLSGALLGGTHDLLSYHPSPQDALNLWTVYLQNVEPICKLLHVPTTSKMIEKVSQQPDTASKAQECLLFAIYHFAIFSMSDEDCLNEFQQPRANLLSKYQYAIRQALVNASWLKTTAMVVMQALVLFLMCVRSQFNPHTFWILTGVAVRIGQRMGLHRDGEALGLPPFDVQMRRRLFWQLLPLDGFAGQMSGTGISLPPDSWDTKQPLNLNDDQIYPGMLKFSEEPKGATEMILFLAKTELSTLYTRTGVKKPEVGSIQLKGKAELERRIDEVESLIESKYLRYCDIVNPTHFLAMGLARSSLNAARLRNRIHMRQLINQSIDDDERRELCSLAQKVLDTNKAIYANPEMKRFFWSIRSLFLIDALICVVSSLAIVGFFPPTERDAMWDRIEGAYINHQEILAARKALYIVVGKITLRAWLTNPPSKSLPEPSFINMLRSQRRVNTAKRSPNNTRLAASIGQGGNLEPSIITPPSIDGDAFMGSLDIMDLDLDTLDWMFWD